MLWLLVGSLAMWAATVNIEKFALRPPSPVEWLDARSQDAEALVPKLTAESRDPAEEHEWKRDWDSLVWLLMEYGNRQKAQDEAAAMPPLRPDASKYDEDYVQRLLRLARTELMHDNVRDMVFTFQHLYEYDKQHLQPSDLRLCRDYNNMGLACLLAGASSDNDGLRADLYQQAGDWLHQAEAGFPQSSRTSALGVLENEVMLAEAQKNKGLADQLRHRVDVLRAQLNGKFPQVTL